MKTYKLFVVPIGNWNFTEEIEFHPRVKIIKNHQESSYSFCLSSLTWYFHSIGENKAATDLKNCIEE